MGSFDVLFLDPITATLQHLERCGAVCQRAGVCRHYAAAVVDMVWQDGQADDLCMSAGKLYDVLW